MIFAKPFTQAGKWMVIAVRGNMFINIKIIERSFLSPSISDFQMFRP